MMKKERPDVHAELELCRRGRRLIVGLDEAGRGAWAGPVVAGAVALPLDLPQLPQLLEGVRDSKQLSARQRERLVPIIQTVALAWGVGFVPANIIDHIGIVPAVRLAMLWALLDLGLFPDHLLIDALSLPQLNIPQTSIIKGDAKCLSIAAASVIAKVARDRWMAAQEKLYPGYHFAAHKGYGTLQHRRALATLGPSPLHRLSFAPLRRALQLSSRCKAPEA